MAEFFVNKQADSDHTVHLSTCGQLPAQEQLMYIGSYASAQAAYKIATGYYPAVSYCPDCLPKAS